MSLPALLEPEPPLKNGNGHKHTFEGEPGVVTVDVLNRLIKENPTNMTQAIREWMNKGRTT